MNLRQIKIFKGGDFLKLTKNRAYVCLILSVILGQVGTGCLEACEAFTKPAPIAGLIIAYIISYWCLSKALMLINLSIAFATWLAIGTIGSALMGIFLFHQALSAVGWGAIIVMIAGIFLLNFCGTPKEETKKAGEGEQ